MVKHYMNGYLIYVHSEYLRGKLKHVFITVMGNKMYFLRKEKNSHNYLSEKPPPINKNNGRKKGRIL